MGTTRTKDKAMLTVILRNTVSGKVETLQRATKNEALANSVFRNNSKSVAQGYELELQRKGFFGLSIDKKVKG